ncbi:MAG: tetratricopeptide repeat protein [Hyphomicrobiales bacterium]
MKSIPSLYVGIGVGTYDHENFEPLPKAIDEVKSVGKALEALYEVQLIEDPSLADAPAKLMEKLPQEILKKGGHLVIYWSGHGEPASEGKLHLVLKDGKPKQTPLITPEYLAGEAARTGANQVLLIFDTCFAGGGVFPAGKVVNDVHREWPPGNPNVWIGVLASAMEYEKARDGVFGARLLKLLREGPDPDPSDLSIIYRWSEKNEGVKADDLIYTLLKEWKKFEDQRPKQMVIGPANCELRIPNPKYNPDAPDRVVEHLRRAAQGVAPGEEGFYFTGRAGQIARIVSWLRASKPGLFVITGPPGSGKSAIAGRIVSLSNPVERSRLLAQSPLEHDDPGEGSVHAHLYARGVTSERLCQLIDEQLVRRGIIQGNPGGPRNKWELLGAIERIQGPPVFVVDGLEEAGDEAWRIAEDVIRLLATKCLVLVSTRELPPREEGGLSLLQTLVPGETIDLGEEAIQEETRRDVGLYIKRRLSSVSGEIDPAKIAAAIARIAQEEREGLFLLARIITSQLLTTPVDTSVPGWEALLDRSIDAAFERELSALPGLRRDNQELPQAARELLIALAWAYGSGLSDDIWPIVATALSPTETNYQRDDLFWLLGQAGRFVVEGGEGGRAVYRLAHQPLVEHLRPKPIKIDDRAIAEDMAARIVPALIKHYLELMESGQPPQSHPYLWNYAWRHCSDAGERGLTALRELVNRDSAAFLPDLAMSLNNLGIRYSEVGRRQEAVAPTEEAVTIHRKLAETNPAFLPDLATSLNNLGISYSEVGRQDDVDSVWEGAIGSITLAWAKAFLFIRRAAGRPERDLSAVGDLLAAQALITDEELDALEYHAVCRSRREQDPATFDDEWRRRSGQEVPEWLVRDRPGTGV